MRTLAVRRTRLGALGLLALGFAALVLLVGCTPEINAEIQTYGGINQIRAQHGMPPLQADARLVDVARQRSQDMAARGYFGHNPPDGCNYVCIMSNRGVPYSYAGENIAWNTWDWDETAGIAVDMWRNSPPHMQNILGCHYDRFGSGVARGRDGKIYFTMIFEGNRAC
jgi:uncharacterized protein YkwD